jgi:hypothetical protein
VVKQPKVFHRFVKVPGVLRRVTPVAAFSPWQAFYAHLAFICAPAPCRRTWRSAAGPPLTFAAALRYPLTEISGAGTCHCTRSTPRRHNTLRARHGRAAAAARGGGLRARGAGAGGGSGTRGQTTSRRMREAVVAGNSGPAGLLACWTTVCGAVVAVARVACAKLLLWLGFRAGGGLHDL